LEQPQDRDLTSKLQEVTEAAKPHLSNGEFQELEELLAEYKDFFAVDSEDHGRTNKVYHLIDMGDARPIRQPPRRLPQAKQAEVIGGYRPPSFWSGKRMGNSVSAWTPEVEGTFQTLKGALCAAPILAHPQPGERFIVYTDASNVRIGGVPSQVQDGQQQVIAYYSKTINKAERNYCVTRRELLAIVRTLEHFHQYLYGQEFHLHTNHYALTWLLSFKNVEGQTARWIQRLQEYNFTFEHRQGRKHINADALSRRPCQEESRHCHKVGAWADIKNVRAIAAAAGWDPATLRMEQSNDPDIGPILQGVETGQRSEWKVKDVLTELHGGSSGGHLGVNKTLNKFRQHTTASRHGAIL
jgi:hypothetical protein